MRTLFLISILVMATISYGAKPSGEEIKKVNDYYQSGGDPILVEKKTCTTVGRTLEHTGLHRIRHYQKPLPNRWSLCNDLRTR